MLTFIVSSGQPPPVTHVPLPIVPLYSTYKLFPHIPLPIVHLHSTNKLFPHINVILFNDWEVCLTERLSCECNIMLVQDRSILPNEHHSRCNFIKHKINAIILQELKWLGWAHWTLQVEPISSIVSKSNRERSTKKAKVKESDNILAQLIPPECICFNDMLSRAIINTMTRSTPHSQRGRGVLRVIVFHITICLRTVHASMQLRQVALMYEPCTSAQGI